MLIFVDGRMIRSSGIGRHIEGHLAQLDSRGHELLVALPSEAHKEDLSRISHAARSVIWDAEPYSWGERVSAPDLFCRGSADVDVFWFPVFCAPVWQPRRSVVTIHDLIQLTSGRTFDRRAKSAAAGIVLSGAVCRARRVACVSRYTEKRLLKKFPCLADKTRIVPNGVDPTLWHPLSAAEREEAGAELGLKRFVLAVGTKKAHKNQALLLEMMEHLETADPELHLLLVGSYGSDRTYWETLLSEWKRSHPRLANRVVDMEDVEDRLLRRYYGLAEALLMPSLEEGFGIPPLEAMAMRTPVICSDAASLPEVVGEAAVVIPPWDPALWASTLTKTIQDPELRARLVARGEVRIRCWSWREAGAALEAALIEAA